VFCRCDRILWRSMPHVEGRLLPLRAPGPDGSGSMDWYRSVNELYRVSDHSPICGVFRLLPELTGGKPLPSAGRPAAPGRVTADHSPAVLSAAVASDVVPPGMARAALARALTPPA
jgi:hypothetical protein